MKTAAKKAARHSDPLAMDTVPQAETVNTGVKGIKPLVQGLKEVLADTYRLVFKSHAYHWNVEGPLFFSLHNLTEGQYTDMFAAADVLAERIRALGQLAPMTMVEITGNSVIKDLDMLPSAQQMVDDLAQDHATVARRFHKLIETATKNDDPVTADLATSRSAFHEKAAWMLRATAK